MNEATDKKKGHILDLKLPIGWLFSAYGILLIIYGLASKAEMYERTFGLNVNIIWGLVLLVFGGIFLFFAYVKKNRK